MSLNDYKFKLMTQTRFVFLFVTTYIIPCTHSVFSYLTYNTWSHMHSEEETDPDNGGVLTWSVLYNEVCLCQAGLRITTLSTSCTGPEEDANSDVWFIDDDPEPLAWQENWNKDAMDRLLGRVEYCCKY